MKMYIDESIMPFTAFGITSLSPSSVTFTPSNIFCATSSLITSDPQLEAELLTDVSHVALDVSTFLSPSTLWLRFLNVVGRVLVLSSDYIQDDRITPDELVFQVTMLAISTHMFAKSAWPLIMAVFSISALTVRDRRTYALLFGAVGLSILQFKTLLASRTLDWLEYAPGEIEDLNGEYMYFLYSGAATTFTGNKISSNKDTFISETVFSEEEGMHLTNRIFGDVQFAKKLEASVRKKAKKQNSKSNKRSKNHSAEEASNSNVVPQRSFAVGSKGASMLRISTPKLLQLMKDDDELSSSIQRLVLLCMQEKLSRTLQESESKLSSKNNADDLQPSDLSSSTLNATRVIPAKI